MDKLLVAAFACFASYVAFLVSGMGELTWLPAMGLVCLTLLVVVRQLAMARENARLLAEQAQRLSEARFHAMVEHSSDVIFLVDADTTLRFVSSSIRRVFGYSPAELLETPLTSLLHPEDAMRAEAFFNELRSARTGEWLAPSFQPDGATIDAAATDELVSRTSWRVRHADGTYRTVESVVTNQLHDEALAGIVLNCRDVTDRIELEERLHQAQKMEAIGRLAGGVAHDFNNVLMAIKGNAELVLGELEKDTLAHADVMEISRSADRGAALTRQLLAFSRKQVLRPRAVVLQTVVSGLELMLRRLIMEDVQLVLHAEAEACHVMADPMQLEQVVMNLAINGRDAMPDGGILTLTTERVCLTTPVMSQSGEIPAGEYATLSVSDTGVGMSDAMLTRIFEPFFTTKGTGKGTGLGLATVYGIVSQSGGYVQVTSRSGVGTVFRVYLPLATAQEEELIELPPEFMGAREGHVLLVEDENAVRGSVKRMLERVGYQVTLAENGRDALGKFTATPDAFDLVLTDAVMPEMGGRELVERVREIREVQRVAIMSGYTDDQRLLDDIRSGEVIFLQKPFTAGQLMEAMLAA